MAAGSGKPATRFGFRHALALDFLAWLTLSVFQVPENWNKWHLTEGNNLPTRQGNGPVETRACYRFDARNAESTSGLLVGARH